MTHTLSHSEAEPEKFIVGGGHQQAGTTLQVSSVTQGARPHNGTPLYIVLLHSLHVLVEKKGDAPSHTQQAKV